MLLHDFVSWLCMSKGDVQDIEYLQAAVDVLVTAPNLRFLLPANTRVCHNWSLQLVMTLVARINLYSFIIC